MAKKSKKLDKAKIADEERLKKRAADKAEASRLRRIKENKARPPKKRRR